tara:strand:+ start:2221 stop:2397 length:177 start_codon:yes stop_codon:yes gene_type:complete
MGNDKEIITQCAACEEEIEPIKINKSKNLYSCPICDAVLHIEQTVEFEPDMDIDRTLH